MTHYTVQFSSDDFHYKVEYMGRLGRRYASGFYHDMEVEVQAVYIGAGDGKWLHIPKEYLGATAQAWIEEQCQDNLASVGPED